MQRVYRKRGRFCHAFLPSDGVFPSLPFFLGANCLQMVVIVPRKFRMDFFFNDILEQRRRYSPYADGSYDEECDPDIEKWIFRLHEQLSTAPRDSNASISAREDLEQLCELVLRRMKVWKTLHASPHSWPARPAPFSDEVVAGVLAESIFLNKKELFLKAYDICLENATLPTFRGVGTALLRCNVEESLLLKYSTSALALLELR